ncbi:MAG: hypothetical protein HYV27_15395 [Candidatus Hydrogenedentes bacterium]|nr:hypothetical protein [Candidatus Hydrogenedentota bacterium]
MKSGQAELVGAFSNEMEAKLVQGMLKEQGIPSTVHRFSRYRAMGGGGYTLKTAPEFKKRAEQFIQSKKGGPVDMDEYVDADDRSYRRCPQCNSVNVSADAYTGRQWVLGACTLGIGLAFVKRNWRCAKCKESWHG